VALLPHSSYLGDRINNAEAGGDAKRTLEVRNRLEAVGVPVLFVYGNHDLKNMEAAEQRNLLGKQSEYESLDFRGFHLVLLNSQDPRFGKGGGTLSDRQLRWLEGDLRKPQGPAIVFCHHPLDEQDTRAHRDFSKQPEFARAVNRDQARTLFTRSGKVRAVFQAHMHWNHIEVVDGIPYITVESLVDSRNPGLIGQPAGGFAEVIVEETGRVDVEVQGLLPMMFAYP